MIAQSDPSLVKRLSTMRNALSPNWCDSRAQGICYSYCGDFNLLLLKQLALCPTDIMADVSRTRFQSARSVMTCCKHSTFYELYSLPNHI